MLCIHFYRRSVALVVLAIVSLFGSMLVVAQEASVVSHTRGYSRVRCSCESWTCPACQQQRICDPQLNLPLLYPPSPAPGSPSGGQPPVPGESTQSGSQFSIDDNSAFSSPSGQTPASVPDTSNLFAANLATGGLGAFGSSLLASTTPEMMGDFFGQGGVPSVFVIDGEYAYEVTAPSSGYNLGRMKMAENNSPIPRDRIFFNYSYFTGVPLSTTPISVHRFSPGFEKTFWDGLASFELRTPMGLSLDNNIMLGEPTDDSKSQFGNLFLALKGVLIERETWLLTGGTSLSLPTAPSTRFIDPFSNEVFLQIDNKSTRLMPFLGGVFAPAERCFAQWMVQCDIDLNGNPVRTIDEGNSTRIGVLQDFTLLYTDLSIGYWLYQAPRRGQHAITGIAPIFEVHYNRALNSADRIDDGNNVVVNPLPDFDNVNIQTGLIFNIRDRSRLGIGFATPLGNSTDRMFDKEFRFTFNRYF